MYILNDAEYKINKLNSQILRLTKSRDDLQYLHSKLDDLKTDGTKYYSSTADELANDVDFEDGDDDEGNIEISMEFSYSIFYLLDGHVIYSSTLNNITYTQIEDNIVNIIDYETMLKNNKNIEKLTQKIEKQIIDNIVKASKETPLKINPNSYKYDYFRKILLLV